MRGAFTFPEKSLISLRMKQRHTFVLKVINCSHFLLTLSLFKFCLNCLSFLKRCHVGYFCPLKQQSPLLEKLVGIRAVRRRSWKKWPTEGEVERHAGKKKKKVIWIKHIRCHDSRLRFCFANNE